MSLYIYTRALLLVLREVLYLLSREKGRYRYAGQWKHGRMHGCGVFEVNERVLHVGAWIRQNLCFNLLTIINLLQFLLNWAEKTGLCSWKMIAEITCFALVSWSVLHSLCLWRLLFFAQHTSILCLWCMINITWMIFAT